MRLALFAEEFSLFSPAQQILDRFLRGYTCEGELRPAYDQVVLSLRGDLQQPEVRMRVRDHQLMAVGTDAEAAASSDAFVIVPARVASAASDRFVEKTLSAVPRSSKVYVHGTLASTYEAAQRHLGIARQRQVDLFSGSYLATTVRLPPIDVPREAAVAAALVVVVGDHEEVPFRAVDALLPFIERRRGGEAGIAAVTALEGDAVWRAQNEGRWSRALLSAALSRSSTPQGDPRRDGRTQNLLGLGKVPHLAAEPQAYLIEHTDGLLSTVLVLNGVIGEANVALRLQGGGVLSTQLFEQPAPHPAWDDAPLPTGYQWSTLVARLDEAFRGGGAWPIERGVATASLVELMARAREGLYRPVEGPGRALAYRNDQPSMFENRPAS